MTIKTTDIDQFLRNPLSVARVIIEEIKNGTEEDLYFSSASLPIVSTLEANIVTTTSMVDELTRIQRSMFAGLAVTWQDIFNHLNDTDYLNIFSLPSRVDSRGIQMSLSLAELTAKSVATNDPDVRMLTIPKHTSFTAGDLTFTTEYPIDIRINSQGDVTTIYDTTDRSDLLTLSNNQVRSEVVNYNIEGVGMQFLNIFLELNQYGVEAHYMGVDQSSSLTMEIPFTDQFYYCEAYMANGSKWTKIHVTHSQMNMNLNEPTLMVQARENRLSVKMPRVYRNNKTLTGQLKILVYTTRGQLVRDLTEYASSQYGMALGGGDYKPNKFTAPIGTLTDYFIVSNAMCEGGRNAKSFEEVKDIVHRRAINDDDVPITHDQLTVKLEDLGYTIRLHEDTLTQRIFLASRNLPAPTGLRFSTPIDSRLCTYDFEMSSLSEHPHVYDNGTRLTIRPSAMFELVNDMLHLLTPSQLEDYTVNMTDAKINELSARKLLQPAFHYVIDASGGLFDARPYFLTSPSIGNREFIKTNERLGLSANVLTIDIAKLDTGYTIIARVSYSDVIGHFGPEEQLHAQLSFVPYRSNNRAYVEGTYVGDDDDGMKIYKFDLDSTFDIDNGDHLYFNNFDLDGSDATVIPSNMNHTFAITLAVTGYVVFDDVSDKLLDDYYRKESYTGDVHVVSAEAFDVEFGHRVENFWTGATSYLGASDFVRHTTDKIRYYERDVYTYDENGFLVFTNNGDGTFDYPLVHAAGDPVLDADGEITYEWRIGDIVVDGNGDPLVHDSLRISRSVDMFLIDGRFSFITDLQIPSYVGGIPNRISEWSRNELSDIAAALIHNSKLLFKPTDTYGNVNAVNDEGTSIMMGAEQSPIVRFYIEGPKVSDSDLQEFLRGIATRVLIDHIGRKTISKDMIATDIRDLAGDDVVSVKVSNIGGSEDYDVITINDADRRFSLAKRMTRLANGTITIVDDITFEFMRH